VEEKLEKPTILVCLIYITQVPKEWAGTVMPRKLKKNGAIASVSFGAERNLPSNTETARKQYHRTYPRQLVSDEDETKLTGSTSTPLHITTPREILLSNN
jgi:hypothetical protein